MAMCLQFFSKNAKPTIVTKDPAWQVKIGTAKQMSFLDIKLANLMYSCAGKLW